MCVCATKSRELKPNKLMERGKPGILDLLCFVCSRSRWRVARECKTIRCSYESGAYSLFPSFSSFLSLLFLRLSSLSCSAFQLFGVCNLLKMSSSLSRLPPSSHRVSLGSSSCVYTATSSHFPSLYQSSLYIYIYIFLFLFLMTTLLSCFCLLNARQTEPGSGTTPLFSRLFFPLVFSSFCGSSPLSIRNACTHTHCICKSVSLVKEPVAAIGVTTRLSLLLMASCRLILYWILVAISKEAVVFQLSAKPFT